MATNSRRRILIMAGGTGGHVIPALSLAHALQAKGVDVEWLGSPRGIENRLVPNAGIMLHTIAIEGLRGKGLAGWCKAPINLSRAVMQARRIIKRFKPDVVVGLGALPVARVGWRRGCRVCRWSFMNRMPSQASLIKCFRAWRRVLTPPLRMRLAVVQ